jgi:ankyrin repeat protein
VAGAVRLRNYEGKYPLDLAVGARKLSVIRCLVEAWSGAVEQSYRNGTMLLHKATCDAFGDGETLNVIQYLAEQRPQSVRDVDRDGKVPLHLAVKNHLFSTASFLVEAWQGSVKVKCHDGMLPIHVAVMGRDSTMARFLVQQWPESLREEVKNGWLPLHLALWQWPSEPWMLGAVRFLVEQNPESLHEATEEGYLPLHIAAGRGRTLSRRGGSESAQRELDLVRLLCDLAPASVRIASRDGSLPLHCAANTGDTIPVTQFLVEQYREAIHVGNNEGITPLLTALARNVDSTELGFEEPCRYFEPRLSEPSTELVRLLVDRRLVKEDHRGPPPLHFAIANGQPLEVLTCLVEHHPVCLLRKDEQGLFAIHVAVAHDPPLLELVHAIVAKRPESVNDTDDGGATPLHFAVALRPPSQDLVEFLVRQPFPTVQARDDRGLLPLQVAAESDAPLELLYWLAVAWPEAVYSDRQAPTQTYIDRPKRPKRPKYR